MVTILENDKIRVGFVPQDSRYGRASKTRVYVDLGATDPRNKITDYDTKNPETKALIRAYVKMQGATARAAVAAASHRLDAEDFTMRWSWKAGCACGCSCGQVGSEALTVDGVAVNIYVTVK